MGQGNLNPDSFHRFPLLQWPDDGHRATRDPYPKASAVAINDASQVTGNYYTSAANSGPFLYANGKFTNLGAPAGTSTSAFAINSIGQVAGEIFFNSGAPSHAAVCRNGVWTDLGAISGASSTHATGINTAGQVVGIAIFRRGELPSAQAGQNDVGFIVVNGSPVNLDTLIPANSGFTITDAIAINDAGDILCDATISSGHEHAVLLTPK